MTASDILLVIQTVLLAVTAVVAGRSASAAVQQARLSHDAEMLRRHTNLRAEKMVALQRVADDVAELGSLAADMSNRITADLVNRVPLAQAKLKAALAAVRYGAWRLERCHDLAEAPADKVLILSRDALGEIAEALASFQSNWDSPRTWVAGEMGAEEGPPRLTSALRVWRERRMKSAQAWAKRNE